MGEGIHPADQKLEIMMTDLDQKKMMIFHKAISNNGLNVRKMSGIDKLMPGMKIDDFLFDPYGYSMNGVLDEDDPDPDPEYMTIHVTPQSGCSYASFETNTISVGLELIQKVLDIFCPGRFIISFYATESSSIFKLHEEFRNCLQIEKWKRTELQICSNEGWELTYGNFFNKRF